jgi:hypothetical protein
MYFTNGGENAHKIATAAGEIPIIGNAIKMG